MTNYTGPLYETFGTFNSTKERLLDTKDQLVDIPHNELTDGLKDISVHLYGDSPREIFVHVIATTQERATEVFYQTLVNLNRNIKEWIKNG